MITALDTDKDGDEKVAKEEAPADIKPVFDKIDSNSDGVLEKGEIEEALKKRVVGSRSRRSGGEGRGRRSGGEGGGRRSGREGAARR